MSRIFLAISGVRLKNPQAPFDPKALEKQIASDPGQGAFGAYFLLGRILELTGRKDLTVDYYQRAIRDPATNPLIRPLAIQAVRAQGHEPDWKSKVPRKK